MVKRIVVFVCCFIAFASGTCFAAAEQDHCGTSNGKSFTSMTELTSNGAGFCANGFVPPFPNEESDKFTWECFHDGDARISECSANKVAAQEPVCGFASKASYRAVSDIQSSDLCFIGTSSNISQDAEGYHWTCSSPSDSALHSNCNAETANFNVSFITTTVSRPQYNLDITKIVLRNKELGMTKEYTITENGPWSEYHGAILAVIGTWERGYVVFHRSINNVWPSATYGDYCLFYEGDNIYRESTINETIWNGFKPRVSYNEARIHNDESTFRVLGESTILESQVARMYETSGGYYDGGRYGGRIDTDYIRGQQIAEETNFTIWEFSAEGLKKIQTYKEEKDIVTE